MFVCFYCYLSFAVIFFSHLSVCNCKGSTAEKKFTVCCSANCKQSVTNSSKIVTSFFGLRKISLERTSNSLLCTFQRFLCFCCAHFALLKTGVSKRNLTRKGLKIESFLQKTQNFLRFFLRPPPKATNFNTSPVIPPFKNFSLNTWTVKKNLL